ncbi:MAG: hypothetical protein H0W88_00645 [Parachlamydiaceae bacterium]|nr:hypothetical protein [Parachlamydiaceae bacterium]
MISLAILGFIFLFGFNVRPNSNIVLSSEMAQKMGLKIWKNECGGKIEGLTSWNEGEEFASLGIGHFIWYPAGEAVVFQQSFPSLLETFKKNKVALPLWLNDAVGCPWKSRQEFIESKETTEMKELRQILSEQLSLQVSFMVDRLQNALPAMLKSIPNENKKAIAYQFHRLARTPQGVFVLLDYINFKGEGISSKERYQTEGWGLVQVLTIMKGSTPETAVKEFIDSAKKILSKRVQNSPKERNEHRWLRGWYSRIDGYTNI